MARPLPESAEPTETLLDRFGTVPLPPYIRKGCEEPGDRLRYQTLLRPGSRRGYRRRADVAGLHFTADLLARLDARGVGCTDLTLHVGLGTFRPIAVERIEDHVLHAEWAELSHASARAINARRDAGGRIVAVGTTSAPVLETAADGRHVHPFVGETALYLKPGHVFHAVDALVTNFHLPRSSLLVLVSAFAGVDLIRAAYAEAVRRRYRFYSYGDAMIIL